MKKNTNDKVLITVVEEKRSGLVKMIKRWKMIRKAPQ